MGLRNEKGIFLGLGFQEADSGSSAQELVKYYTSILDRFGKARIFSKTVSFCTDSGKIKILLLDFSTVHFRRLFTIADRPL